MNSPNLSSFSFTINSLNQSFFWFEQVIYAQLDKTIQNDVVTEPRVGPMKN